MYTNQTYMYKWERGCSENMILLSGELTEWIEIFWRGECLTEGNDCQEFLEEYLSIWFMTDKAALLFP